MYFVVLCFQKIWVPSHGIGKHAVFFSCSELWISMRYLWIYTAAELIHSRPSYRPTCRSSSLCMEHLFAIVFTYSRWHYAMYGVCKFLRSHSQISTRLKPQCSEKVAHSADSESVPIGSRLCSLFSLSTDNNHNGNEFDTNDAKSMLETRRIEQRKWNEYLVDRGQPLSVARFPRLIHFLSTRAFHSAAQEICQIFICYSICIKSRVYRGKTYSYHSV